MLIFIENTPRAYSWGSRDALARLLGTRPTGEPQAELWLGSHPEAPATIAKASSGCQTLIDLIKSDPERYGVAGGPLPFLMKVLAIGAPLSLQVHPNLAQAQAGYAAEDAAGVPRDARERNYGDPNHKPELLVALSAVSALSGFRPLADVLSDIERLTTVAREAGIAPEPLIAVSARLSGCTPEDARRELLEWAFGGSAEAAAAVEVIEQLVRCKIAQAGSTPADIGTSARVESENLAAATGVGGGADADGGDDAERMDAARRAALAVLVATHPGDPGILVSLLLHLVQLEPGEAIFLAPGQLHAYLGGVAVEVMAASDNVLRAGLTEKHVDVAELCRIVDTSELVRPRFTETRVARGLTAWRPPVDDFQLLRATLHDPELGDDAAKPRDSARLVELAVPHPLVLVVIRGTVRIERAGTAIDALDEVASARRGQSLYVSAGAPIRLTGHGEAFIAAVGDGFDDEADAAPKAGRLGVI